MKSLLKHRQGFCSDKCIRCGKIRAMGKCAKAKQNTSIWKQLEARALNGLFATYSDSRIYGYGGGRSEFGTGLFSREG